MNDITDKYNEVKPGVVAYLKAVPGYLWADLKALSYTSLVFWGLVLVIAYKL